MASKKAVDIPLDLANTRRHSHKLCQGDAAAVDSQNLPNCTFEVVYACSVAVNSARRALVYKEPLSKLITFDFVYVEKLRLLGEALMHVQGEINNCSKKISALPEHIAEGFELRAILLAYAEVLVMVKAADAAVVAGIKEGTGYRDLVEDLESLQQLHSKALTALTGPINQTHINRAAELSNLIGQELTAKDDSDTLADLLLERRQLSFLLTKAHHQVRRAILFLCDDEAAADAIIPSLYAPNAGRPAKETPSIPQYHQAAAPAPTAAGPTKSTDPLDNPFDDKP